jgi:hypothetical protein
MKVAALRLWDASADDIDLEEHGKTRTPGFGTRTRGLPSRIGPMKDRGRL